MPRKRRQDPPQEPPQEQTLAREAEVQSEATTRETYEVPGQDHKQLDARADDFLAREQARDESRQGHALVKRDPGALTQKTREKAIVPVGNEDKRGAAANRRPEYYTLLGAAIGVAGLVVGLVAGVMLNHHSGPAGSGSQTQVAATKNLALHNVVSTDSMYGATLKITEVSRHIDGLYVTVQVTNAGTHTIYMMANTMKMVGSDGHLYLPELGQGQVPPTFEGAGLPPGTSDEATLVFSVPQNVNPTRFILENVTNLVNGSFTFDVAMK